MLRPGDWVEAVVGGGSRRRQVRRGELYEVLTVDPEIWRDCSCKLCGDACRGDGIKLVAPKIPDHLWWCSARFRKIYRPRPELVATLMEKSINTLARATSVRTASLIALSRRL